LHTSAAKTITTAQHDLRISFILTFARPVLTDILATGLNRMKPIYYGSRNFPG
jgi:hypothetical protein